MTVETGAIVTNFVANTASFEKGTKQAAKSAQGLSVEALSSASAVAGAFGLNSPAISAFSNLTGQIMRAQKAHQSISAAMVGGVGFAGIGIAIGALTANFQALGAAVADVNKMVEDGTVKGVPLQSIWRQIAETYGLVKEQAWALRMEIESQAEYQSRMAKQRSDLLAAERKDWTEVEKAQQLVLDREEELNRAMRDRPKVATEDQTRQLAAIEQAKERATSGAGLFKAGEYDKLMQELEAKRAEIQRQIASSPGQNNAETDRAKALAEYAKAAAEQAQWNELVKGYDEAVKLANEEAAEQARLAREAEDAWDAAAEATNRFNTEAAAGAEQTRQTNEEWAKYYQGVQNEKNAKEMVANTRNWERPAATEKGTTADYRAGLSNQDAAMNVQKNIETLNKRMAASLATIEKNLKLETVRI